MPFADMPPLPEPLFADWGTRFPDAGPFLHWIGGKGSLLREIGTAFPETFQNYYEPFLGGGAVFYSLIRAGRVRPPWECRLSDVNPRLIDAYVALRDDTDAVVSAVAELVSKTSRDTYYAARERFNAAADSGAQSAADLIYCCVVSFRGSFGQADMTRPVSIGYGSGRALPSLDRLRAAAGPLQLPHVGLRVCDFTRISPSRGDLVYADPPYDAVSVRYGEGEFGEAGQIRLAEAVRDWERRGASVIISNSDTPRIRELYADYPMRTLREPSGSYRLGRNELLIAAGPVSRINRYWENREA